MILFGQGYFQGHQGVGFIRCITKTAMMTAISFTLKQLKRILKVKNRGVPMEKRLEYSFDNLIAKMSESDVYLIEVCRHLNNGKNFTIRVSNNFSYGNYKIYDIATGNWEQCHQTIIHINLMLKKQKIPSRLYNSTDQFYPISIIIWPNMSYEIIKSIEYIENGYMSRTVDASENI